MPRMKAYSERKFMSDEPTTTPVAEPTVPSTPVETAPTTETTETPAAE